MALETGTYISDLVVTNPPGTDLKSQGDDHLRLIKSTIKNTFPNITGAVTPTHTELNYVDGVASAIQTQLDGKPLASVIINGAFDVWQRGTTFAAIASTDISADRWAYSASTEAVITAARSTDVPTVAQAGQKLNYSLHLDVTTADGTIGAAQYALIRQRIEGYLFNKIAQRAFFLSFWVKATKTGTYCVGFLNSGSDRSYVAEYTISAADTWEYKTVAVPASPTAGTWDYTNGIGLQVVFPLAVGSSFQTTAGSWQTGGFFGTSNQVNALDSTANNFRLAMVKLVPGDRDTHFDIPTIEETLAACQRYYWRGLPAAAFQFSSYVSGAAASWPVKFPVTMRDVPSLGSDFTGIVLSNCNTPAVAVPTVDGCRLLVTSTAVTPTASFAFAATNFIGATADL